MDTTLAQFRTNLYIIGAQSTGKTTLVHDFAALITANHPGQKFTIIQEIARSILKSHGFDRDDIRNSEDRSMELQMLILEGQFAAEQAVHEGFIISDRSGLDPLVYARYLFGVGKSRRLAETPEWRQLRERMRNGVVVVCEAGVEWLVDDGVRLMPQDRREWMGFHEAFCEVLREEGIPYAVVKNEMATRDERVQFVYNEYQTKIGA